MREQVISATFNLCIGTFFSLSRFNDEACQTSKQGETLSMVRKAVPSPSSVLVLGGSSSWVADSTIMFSRVEVGVDMID
jgi:hypothetical protein